MKDFFRYATDIPAGEGFRWFGTCHVMWLVFIAVFTIVSAVIYRRLYINSETRNIRIFKMSIGLIMPVISIYRDIVLAATGHFDRYYLPLHLCGMALYIGALYCFTTWRFVGVVYVLLCVPGAIGALLFPDWVAYPFWNYMHIHDFISHGLITAWGICLIGSGEVVPEWKEFWMPVVFGLTGVIILTPVNRLLGTNYWFLSIPSEGSPLGAIMNLTGDKWYVVGYILFVTLVVAVWLAIIRGMIHLKDK